MPTTTNPFESASAARPQRDDWEDWEDDDSETGVPSNDLLIDLSDVTTGQPSRSATASHGSPHRSSVQKPIRVKSKGRQKAQNAKAGIKLVTDMTKFGGSRSQQQQAYLASRAGQEDTKGKFVDAAALLALEGEPTSASVGSFSWLKRKPGNLRKDKLGKKATQHTSSDLSPAARPIMIGISVPSDDLSSHQVSPQTAVLETPLDMHSHPLKQATKAGYGPELTPQQQRSVWSPDTEESDSPYSRRAASSVYSQQPSTYGGSTKGITDAPPVPALPATLKFRQSMGATGVNAEDEDDVDTPCTLFEEDGSPLATRKSYRPRGATVSPDSAATSRSQGWWDHVTTPFAQSNPFRQQPQETGSSSSAAPQDWWSGVDEKKAKPARNSRLTILTPSAAEQQRSAPIASSSRDAPPPSRSETHSEKARILAQENEEPSDEPPPYSPPKATPQVKYQAILPPSHTANTANTKAIPSPGLVSPGLASTMTSQGAINMSEIPLTPSGQGVLPDRPVAAYVVGDHFLDASGKRNKTERKRRRHEKEEAVAHKVGGYWRGRGFMSSDGCFGRTGREGRQRRRVCLGIFGGVLAAIILIVVLVVILTRKGSAEQTPESSIWLNLTDFPPIPTGVLTVAGPDNAKAVSGCLENTTETAWTCSLPKEEQDSVAPFLPNQPEFIFQIQYDNDTRALWNISEAKQSKSTSTEDSKTELDRRSIIAAPGITPIPDPPSIAEIDFLGDTTDHIESDNKAGEATPFYISLLSTVDDTVGANVLGRRQGFNNAIGGSQDNGTANSGLSEILPEPVLNSDGTGAPAQLFPLPKQQPLRLFDRGLETEHYGFYTYFDKRTYLTDKDDAVSADKDGGSRLTDAKYVATFTETRFLVQMWTRKVNTTELLGNGTTPGTDGTSVFSTPGTMPYPITVTEDMHGGDSSKKTSFWYGVDSDQSVNKTQAGLITLNKSFDGTIVNDMSGENNKSRGGIDGGTGGCRCEWQNFRTL